MPLNSLPAELLLIAACCRWPRSQARDAAIRAAAEPAVDWGAFLRIARRQRVEGLVSDGLRSAGIEVPPDVVAQLGAEAQAIARQNLRFAAEAARIERALADLPHLFVKGVTLDMIAYRSLGLKRARDIDLLIDPERIEQVCQAVEGLGYTRIQPGPELDQDGFRLWILHCKETIWRHPGNGTVLEVHTGLVDNPALLPGIHAGSPGQMVEVGPGIRLPTLRDEELFAYLCVHGATHAWSRMKWIADVAALLAGREPDAVERLYRRSLTLGVGRCSAQALLLCAQLFGTILPPRLAAELQRDRATALLVRAALHAMAGPNRETELDDTVLGTVPIHLSHFLLGRGWGYRLGEVRRKLKSPQDRSAIRLPRALHFIYPLLLIPSWLWRRVKGPAAL